MDEAWLYHRAWHKGRWVPGKAVPHCCEMYFPFAGQEFSARKYQVLSTGALPTKNFLSVISSLLLHLPNLAAIAVWSCRQSCLLCDSDPLPHSADS